MGQRRDQGQSLSEQLLASSGRFAKLALRDYLEDRLPDFFLHAGTSLEHLAKAYLVSLDPALIVDARSFDSLLHACGEGKHSRIPASRMKTISSLDALERCGQILPTFANLRDDLRPLVDARNGTTHIGGVDETGKSKLLLPYLRASRHLLAEAQWAESDYWKEFTDFVGTRVAEEAEALHRLGKAWEPNNECGQQGDSRSSR